MTPSLLTSRSKGGSSSFFDEPSTKRAGGGGGGLDIDLDGSETAAFHNDSTVQSYSQSNRLTGMIRQHSSSSSSVTDRVAQINSALTAGDVHTLSIIKSKKSIKSRDPDEQTVTQRDGMPVERREGKTGLTIEKEGKTGLTVGRREGKTGLIVERREGKTGLTVERREGKTGLTVERREGKTGRIEI